MISANVSGIVIWKKKEKWNKIEVKHIHASVFSIGKYTKYLLKKRKEIFNEPYI